MTTKMSVAKELFRNLHLNHPNESHIRKMFVEQFNKLHLEKFGTVAKPNLAPTYYQMILNEANGKAGGTYRYHKGMKTKELDAIGIVGEVKVEEVVATETETVTENQEVVNG